MAMDEEIYPVDSCTTGTVLWDTRYLQTLWKYEGSITTIIGNDNKIVGTGRATIILPNGTVLVINEALLYPDSTRTLLSFKDIRANGFHVETNDDEGEECLIMTRKHGDQKTIVESFPSIKESLYYMYVKPQSDIAVFKTIFSNQESYRIWLDRLGHPGLNMMQRIVKNSNGHNSRIKKIFCALHVQNGS